MTTQQNAIAVPSQAQTEAVKPATRIRYISQARETARLKYNIADPVQKKEYIGELKKISCRAYGRLKWNYKFCPENARVFFAFSEKQLDEGRAENGYTDKAELRQSQCGAIGSENALAAYWREMNYRIALFGAIVRQYFRPEEVYLYEFGNHECSYTWDDSEALEAVQEFWPGWTPQPEFRHMLLTAED